MAMNWTWETFTHLFNKHELRIINVLMHYSRFLGYINETNKNCGISILLAFSC